MHILGLCGSLRRDSLNRRLLAAAARSLPHGVTLQTSEHVGALPLFDEDMEVEPPHAAVWEFHEAIRDADALLVASPEYNGSLTGPLKNALDWASRPAGHAVLQGVPLAVIGASPSRFGAAWAQAETRRIADRIGARVVPLELAVAGAPEAFTSAGELRDPDLAAQLHRLTSALVDLAGGETSVDELSQLDSAVGVGLG